MTAFWDIAPCSLVEVDRRFRGAYCLHHQDDELIALMIIAPLKRRSISTTLHGAIFQKAVYFPTRRNENLKSHNSNFISFYTQHDSFISESQKTRAQEILEKVSA
jgi:hypothetical protein